MAKESEKPEGQEEGDIASSTEKVDDRSSSKDPKPGRPTTNNDKKDDRPSSRR